MKIDRGVCAFLAALLGIDTLPSVAQSEGPWRLGGSCTIAAPGYPRFSVSSGTLADVAGVYQSYTTIAVISADGDVADVDALPGVTIAIGKRSWPDMVATVTHDSTHNVFSFRLEGNDGSEFLTPLAQGAEFAMTLPENAGGKAVSISLKGSARPASAFRDCVARLPR